jgi:hypothetical protein
MLSPYQQKKLCRDYINEAFVSASAYECHFELWKNYDKKTGQNNGTFYVHHAPYITKHNDTTFICVGKTYEDAKQKAVSQLMNCFGEKDIDFQFSLCEVEQYKDCYIIFN